ncbi:MAG TPA: hypothetical protein VEE82_03755 [Thermodesulfovibrionales bacterium]|nr:hypothetical protein [Thermodesulfovibrionales bacterium]
MSSRISFACDYDRGIPVFYSHVLDRGEKMLKPVGFEVYGVDSESKMAAD